MQGTTSVIATLRSGTVLTDRSRVSLTSDAGSPHPSQRICRLQAGRNMLQILLAAVLTFQVVVAMSEENAFYGTMLDTISNVFVGSLPRIGYQGWDHLNEAPLLFTHEVEAHMEHVTRVYYDLERYLPCSIASVPHGNLTISVVRLRHGSFYDLVNKSTADFSTVTEEYTLTPECPIGPFSRDPRCHPVHFLWWRTVKVSTEITISSVQLTGWMWAYTPSRDQWDLSISYDLSQRTGFIPITWNIRREIVDTYLPVTAPACITQVVVLGVSCLLLAVTLGECSQKRRFSEVGWLAIQMLNESANAVASILVLYAYLTTGTSTWDDIVAKQTLLSAACFLSWLVLVPLVASFPGMDGCVIVVREGLPSAIRLGVCVIAVFMAYACFGTIVFGKYSPNFATLDRTFKLLFDIMVGDSIDNTFIITYDGAQSDWLRFVARLYCYTGVSLTYYIVLNQFIALMEDAYMSAMKRGSAAVPLDNIADISVHTGEPALSERAAPRSYVPSLSSGTTWRRTANVQVNDFLPRPSSGNNLFAWGDIVSLSAELPIPEG